MFLNERSELKCIAWSVENCNYLELHIWSAAWWLFHSWLSFYLVVPLIARQTIEIRTYVNFMYWKLMKKKNMCSYLKELSWQCLPPDLVNGLWWNWPVVAATDGDSFVSFMANSISFVMSTTGPVYGSRSTLFDFSWKMRNNIIKFKMP